MLWNCNEREEAGAVHKSRDRFYGLSGAILSQSTFCFDSLGSHESLSH
jgi:hypothetical protein